MQGISIVPAYFTHSKLRIGHVILRSTIVSYLSQKTESYRNGDLTVVFYNQNAGQKLFLPK
jgi:hypothetical protein